MLPGRALLGAVAGAGLLIILLVVLSSRIGSVPPMGVLLDPVDGLYRNARATSQTTLEPVIPGLEDSVTVYMDERGVPHIFAAGTLDAVRAMGYVIARDRLFQYDFITRVASGRLSELLGQATIEADRFLRNTGMEMGARINAERIRRERGVEAELIDAYCAGVNAYIDELSDADLPFEYRLIGGEPTRCSTLQVARLVQYMAYDLSYSSDGAEYGELRRRLNDEEYDLLYPEHSRLYVPIVDEAMSSSMSSATSNLPAASAVRLIDVMRPPDVFAAAEGFREGKGSNNWAVTGRRSTTGHPILAGDMHLALTLPAVWYEVHINTPEMNTYGVTIPGAPLPVEAFNDHLGWTFTNTGSDQIDHYLLRLDATGTQYELDGAWLPLDFVIDTIRVAGAPSIVDTLVYSHWGPVFMEDDQAIAIQWVAHKPNRTLRALYDMNRASSYFEFEAALRYWDSPMQNILYAGRDGIVAMRSTGHLPVRRGGAGVGLLDGSSADGEWIGRVPFDELPHDVAPLKGYATSTNQQPTNSDYPHYIGHDWRSSYRSIRAAELLNGMERHSPEDLMRYQADVVSVQKRLFLPLFDEVTGLTDDAFTLLEMLRSWDGNTDVDAPEPLILDEVLIALSRLTWDEDVFDGVRLPTETTLYHLLTEHPDSRWFDRVETSDVEVADDILREAVEEAWRVLTERHGADVADWRWGDHHKVIFSHLTGASPLSVLGRGPYPYPGFAETLSPASGRVTTHSASWRVVVDFATSPPVAHGIYPGGQSGNPLDPHYDYHIQKYLDFQYYRLANSADRAGFESSSARTIRMTAGM